LTCQLVQLSLTSFIDKVELVQTPQMKVGLKQSTRIGGVREFVFRGDKVCSTAPYKWVEEADANTSQSILESLAIRRCSIRRIVDSTWTSWAYHIRTACQEQHKFVFPVCKKLPHELCRLREKADEVGAGTKKKKKKSTHCVCKKLLCELCRLRKKSDEVGAGTKKSTCWVIY